MIIQKWDQMRSMHVIRWWLCSCIEISPQSLHWFWRLQLSLFICFDRGHVQWSYYRVRVSKFHRIYWICYVYSRYVISDSFAVYALVFSTTVLTYWNSTTTTTIVQHHPRFHSLTQLLKNTRQHLLQRSAANLEVDTLPMFNFYTPAGR